MQHIALKTDDIFTTMTELRQRAYVGGFDFMPRASPAYYRALPAKLGEGGCSVLFFFFILKGGRGGDIYKFYWLVVGREGAMSK